MAANRRGDGVNLDKTHAWIGVALGGLFILTAAETAAAPGGRAAFVEGSILFATPGALLLPVLIVVSTALHLRTWRTVTAETTPFPSVGVGRIHVALLAMAVVFLVAHFAQTWSGRALGEAAFYDTLRAELGRPTITALYLAGVTASTFAFALAAPVTAERLGLIQDAGQRRIARWASAFIATALWLVLLNTMSHFVVGRAILWGA